MTLAKRKARLDTAPPYLAHNNVVHRHFLWFKLKIGHHHFALLRLYALPGIDSTQRLVGPRIAPPPRYLMISTALIWMIGCISV